MATRPNDGERGFGSDREQQREVSNENARSARATGNDDAANDGDGASARGRSNRGFASMDRSKQREIASKGGRAAHQKGTAHEFDSSEARAAGRKGGVTVSRDREHMAAIGRRGGEARGANRAARLQQQQDGTSTPAAESQSAGQGNRFHGDREVGLDGRSSTQNSPSSNGSRPSGNSLGGESRSNSNNAERNVERP